MPTQPQLRIQVLNQPLPWDPPLSTTKKSSAANPLARHNHEHHLQNDRSSVSGRCWGRTLRSIIEVSKIKAEPKAGLLQPASNDKDSNNDDECDDDRPKPPPPGPDPTVDCHYQFFEKPYVIHDDDENLFVNRPGADPEWFKHVSEEERYFSLGEGVVPGTESGRGHEWMVYY